MSDAWRDLALRAAYDAVSRVDLELWVGGMEEAIEAAVDAVLALLAPERVDEDMWDVIRRLAREVGARVDADGTISFPKAPPESSNP